MTTTRTRLATVSLLLFSALAGCRKSAATTPTGGSPSGTPTILSTSPALPSLSTTTQFLSIQGHDFETGLVGKLSRPDGHVLSFVTTDFKALTSTSFQLQLTLDLAGNYQLTVTNTSGLTSTPYTITVTPAAQGSLTLISVSPSTTVQSTQQQAIFVQGSNFDSTLQAVVTAPDSTPTFFNSPSMTGLNATSFGLNVIFDKVGTYSIVVQNGANSVSNALTIDVRRNF